MSDAKDAILLGDFVRYVVPKDRPGQMSEERISKAINDRSMFAAGLTKTGGGVA